MPDVVVIADMAGGLEHLAWAGGTLRDADVLLVVAENHAKSLLTAGRTTKLAIDLGVREVRWVANRVATDTDLEAITAAAASHGSDVIAVIPEDEDVRRADRDGVSPIDGAPDGPGVRAIAQLGAMLTA